MDDFLLFYNRNNPDTTQLVSQFGNEIYHSSLSLDKTNDTDTSAHYLDLNIHIDSNLGISTALYNKTDDYRFKIMRYPHFDSNIPLRLGLSTLHGEIIRFSRSCSLLDDFIVRVKTIIQEFVDNSYPKAVILNKVKNIVKNNELIKFKYDPNLLRLAFRDI